MNELLIKPDLSDLTEEKEEEDVVKEENGSRADCVFTDTSLETALNQVIASLKSLEISTLVFYYVIISAGVGVRFGFFSKSLTPVFAVLSTTDKRGEQRGRRHVGVFVYRRAAPHPSSDSS